MVNAQAAADAAAAQAAETAVRVQQEDAAIAATRLRRTRALRVRRLKVFPPTALPSQNHTYREAPLVSTFDANVHALSRHNIECELLHQLILATQL